MKIYYGSFSECGPRKNNEDYIAVREIPEHNRYVYVFCDGMGGHDSGEVASKLVAEHICDYWVKNPKRQDSEKKVIDACNETMIAYNNKSHVEMGTTMAMVAIEGNKALLAHCGDSRIYVIRDHKIIYQSVDHVALTPEGWPIITRAFFTGQNNYKPDIEEIEVQVGDLIFVCSDGVYGNGKWSAVQGVLTDPEACIYPLSNIVRIAADKAHDNYSAILIRICDDEPEDTTDSYLFKLRRHPKEGEYKSEYIEFFRTRREAIYRLGERNCFGDKNDIYHYGVSRYPDGKGAKWETNENKQ
jgi:protein serine/threonine phosphatase